MLKLFKNPSVLLLIIILIGGFLRFYKLDWGDGLFAHPDEYHIIISASQLSFPSQMHPNFFSYGTFTIYLIYFTQEILNFFSSLLPTTQYPTPNTFLIGRFYSALFSTLTVFLIYRISIFFLPKLWALTAAGLTALTPGLIQQAHFATPESALIFFLFTSLYFLLQYSQKNNFQSLIPTSLFFGLALATKVSAALFTPVFALIILFKNWGKPLKIFWLIFLTASTTFIIFAIAAPFVFFDWPAFLSNWNYESSLVTGKISVFYTRQFIETTPFIFQLTKIFPYALGPGLLIFGVTGSIFFFIYSLKIKNHTHLLLLITYLLILIPNGLFFAKWTRFIALTFPFFAIFSTFFLYHLSKYTSTIIRYSLYVVIMITTFVWTASSFSIYLRPDVRTTASKWLAENTSPNATFTVEGANTVDLPAAGYKERMSVFLYDLEDNRQSQQELLKGLEKSDYFLVQSRRVFKNHLRLPEQFPVTANFYKALFDGTLGFTQIKEFNSFPSVSIGGFKWEIPDEDAEETWSVFDHPVIRIFQKTNGLSRIEYDRLLDGR